MVPINATASEEQTFFDASKFMDEGFAGTWGQARQIPGDALRIASKKLIKGEKTMQLNSISELQR